MPPRKTAQNTQPAAAIAAGVLPRPIKVDASRLEIPDIALFSRMQNIDEHDQAAMRQIVMDIAPMLDRLVVGGLGGFRIEHMPAVVEEVMRQLGEATDSKN